MKRGRDEEKIMGPMFPRLHVNDADKGGPRAPPRNKMALYEQLSIPSQRFSHSAANNTTANLVPRRNQGIGNERGMFFSQQVSPRHRQERQCSQYSDVSTPSAQVVQRKQKLDKDDFTVPIFTDPVPSKELHNRFNNDTIDLEQEELSSSNPPYFFNHSVEFQNAKGEEPEQSNSSFTENTKRDSSNMKRNLPSEVLNIVNDVSVEMGSREDVGNLERTDSVSETSMLDNGCRPDITPDDALGIIGHKHFWKARTAIANQQRIFAVQLFELHRLLKVQRSMAASPHLLQEDSSEIGKPSKAKKLPSVKLSKPSKPDSEKPSHKKEASAENTIDKSQSPDPHNQAPPSSCKPPIGNASSPPSVLTNESNTSPWSVNHMPLGPHQWLIPVMSPSEGLVYKPVMMGSNFMAPPYCVPPPYCVTPPHPQYHFPSYPPSGTHSYFPYPYSMPVSSPAATFSRSSVEQMGPALVPERSNLNIKNHRGPTADVVEKTTRVSEDLEVQASSSSSRNETLAAGGEDGTAEEGNMLPLFPISPAGDNCNSDPDNGSEGPARVIKVVSHNAMSASARVIKVVPHNAMSASARVIKVVPHNAMSTSASAARIFRSIQEERKQYDSV